MPQRRATHGAASRRSASTAAAAVARWTDAARANGMQAALTLRLLALVLSGSKRAALRFISRNRLSCRVGSALQGRTLLATLRRAALVARALNRGVSARRQSQLAWRVPIAVTTGTARGVEAHSALSVLVSIMLVR